MSDQQWKTEKRENVQQDIHALFESCSQKAKAWNRDVITNLEADAIYRAAFHGIEFPAKSGSESSDAELAARYRVLLNVLRGALSTNERLRFFAQWARAEADLTPEEFFGEELTHRLTSETKTRIGAMAQDDLYYAGIVNIWVPYIDKLFQDAKHVGGSSKLSQRLLSLGYDRDAAELYTVKPWRSPVAFVCEWLANRGDAIQMRKPRASSDITATLRNAYSRIFGTGAPHILTCNFCGESAVGDFETESHISISYCAEHGPEQLPSSVNEALTDLDGRRWWSNGSIIHCDPPLKSL